MHLQYVLTLVAAALAASKGSASVAGPTHDAKTRNLASQDQVYLIDLLISETKTKRMLRGAQDFNEDNTVEYSPSSGAPKKTFIEDKLKDSLSSLETTTRFYDRWYESGYSIEQVIRGLEESKSRDLNETYMSLAKGYAAYVEDKENQTEVEPVDFK
uniref:RxLR effector protein n=1 Tax=Hyaloperonospora arabidopsidis (strain Emoy2) TaxID=559515 RepID=A0A090C2Q5_HYAAE|nr:RxLR effector candidate protein [Hyaloperonospora arabidopsidis Emoy2]